MSGELRTCAGCDATFVVGRYQQARKWCSERCRKRTLYGGTCEDCGAPTSGDSGGGASRPRWCQECGKRHSAERQAAIGRERDRILAGMINQGLSNAEIAKRMGWRSERSVSPRRARAKQRGTELISRHAVRAKRQMDATAARIVPLWREGLNGREIAERLEIPRGAVYGAVSRLRERGYDVAYRQPPGERQPPGLCRACGGEMSHPHLDGGMCAACRTRRHERVVELYEQGLPAREIGERVGLSRPAVSQVVMAARRAGRQVSRRPRSRPRVPLERVA